MKSVKLLLLLLIISCGRNELERPITRFNPKNVTYKSIHAKNSIRNEIVSKLQKFKLSEGQSLSAKIQLQPIDLKNKNNESICTITKFESELTVEMKNGKSRWNNNVIDFAIDEKSTSKNKYECLAIFEKENYLNQIMIENLSSAIDLTQKIKGAFLESITISKYKELDLYFLKWKVPNNEEKDQFSYYNFVLNTNNPYQFSVLELKKTFIKSNQWNKYIFNYITELNSQVISIF